MAIAPIVASATALYLSWSTPGTLLVAAPILLLWFGSPVLAWWISQPLRPRPNGLTPEQSVFLAKVSRRTWAFFETFVGPEDHWLPPDSYQEYAAGRVAHRTSPTNMGLALLANLSANDFGYLPAGKLIERTAKALGTMKALERYRGHLYNWYDTKSLKPLPPLYVSTVDSGNLAGHLLTLRPGLLALSGHEILGSRWLDGLRDTANVLADEALGAGREELTQLETELASATATRPAKIGATRVLLDRLSALAESLVRGLVAQSGRDRDGVSGESIANGMAGVEGVEGRNGVAIQWAVALARQCRDFVEELAFLAPWTSLSAPPRAELALPARLDDMMTVRDLAGLEQEFSPWTDGHRDSRATSAELEWLDELQGMIALASQRARERIATIEALAATASVLADAEYGFLLDKVSHLLAIGYNVSERRRDGSSYDLLASEARLCTFVAIAQGQLPQESWFALGRLLTSTGSNPVLLSWSGSMFEYLMPLLVMPTYENTLLDQTYKAAVKRQIDYGRQRGVPWGISESGYHAVDGQLDYQYRAFGVPGLGLKRGLADDLVIAPYASLLALMVAPEEACLNLERLAAEGFAWRFGFFEAIDYTPSRQRRGQDHAVVKSSLAHHVGMSFLSLAYVLLDRPMQRRFESDPQFQATTLLLKERIPKAAAVYAHPPELSDVRTNPEQSKTAVRVFDTPDTAIPEVQLLSNGRYHVMVTNAGGGYSRWKDIAVTRWREDGTRDHWGTFCYLRDVASGAFWSAAHHPTLQRTENYEAIFAEPRAEFRCRQRGFDTHMEIAVSPEDDIELRRIRITNRSRKRRQIDATSYAEIVLASPAADALHPSFSNLFVQTTIVAERRAILCTRRPRSRDEPVLWMFHLMAVHEAEVGETSYETDRMRFIGRGNTVADPRAMKEAGSLSGTQGPVLDPIVAIRQRISLEPGESATIDIVSGVGESRQACLTLVDKYQDRRLADRVFDLAWTHSQVVLKQLNATEADAQLYARLASSILYANSSLRADTAVLSKNRRGQSGLWGYSISGDLPIVLLQIGSPVNIDIVRQLVQAHAYWRLKGLLVDLVVWNEERSSYRQLLQEQILGLIAAGVDANVTDRPGGIFVRLADQMPEEDRVLQQAVARVILSDGWGSLSDQIEGRGPADVVAPPLTKTRSLREMAEAIMPPLARTLGFGADPPSKAPSPPPDLVFFNGLGGFTRDGREYVIMTARGQETPAPWVNVLANPSFGTVISESGVGYTWSENAHEFRLTPWCDDPVSDASGEAFYIRDEESGVFGPRRRFPAAGSSPTSAVTVLGTACSSTPKTGLPLNCWSMWRWMHQ